MANTTLNQPHPPELFKVGYEDVRKNNKVNRVTVRMTGELGRGINEIQEATGASNPSEVVRRAIAMYHTLIQQKLDGNDPVILIKEGGEVKKTVPIFS